jgi:peroxiredoxin
MDSSHATPFFRFKPAAPILMFLLVLAAGCSESGPGISGQLTGAEGAEVRLAGLGARGFTDMDTVQADASGRFDIPAEALGALALDVYRVNVGKSHFFVIGDSLSSLQVTGNLPEPAGLITDLEVSGDAWTAGFTAFMQEIVQRSDSMAEAKKQMTQQGTTEEKIAGKKAYDAMRDRMMGFVKKTIRDHKNDPVGLMALEHLDLSADRALAKQVIDSTRTLMGHSAAHRNLSQRISTQPKPRQQARRNDLIKPGMPMPDISLNDPSGKQRALSDLRGKVVLVDFWASWCGPCRRENPNVVRAWNEYKDKGFEVFSVSLDKDVSKWERAIAQDGLIWPNHISDLRGWNSVATERFGISSIPHAILIDKDGTVVATHLRGSQLEAELEQLL